jgi:DNA-directed RNA polymerase subunit RPC12/RpoP
MTDKERAANERVCLRCGKDAEWSYPDPDKSRVDVKCTTCGSYQMSREECHLALEEMESEENETRTPG